MVGSREPFGEPTRAAEDVSDILALVRDAMRDAHSDADDGIAIPLDDLVAADDADDDDETFAGFDASQDVEDGDLDAEDVGWVGGFLSERSADADDFATTAEGMRADGAEDPADWFEDDLLDGDVDHEAAWTEGEEEARSWSTDAMAAALVDLLPIASRKRIDAAYVTLCDLLEEFPHSASHRAIAARVREGADLSDLLAIADIVRTWRGDEGLWMYRTAHHGTDGGGAVAGVRSRRLAMTWKKAARLHEAYPEGIGDRLHGGWRDDWRHMTTVSGAPRPNAWFCYAAYLSDVVAQEDFEGAGENDVYSMDTLIAAGSMERMGAHRSIFVDGFW